MHLHKINIRNFRLLEKVEILLEKRTTVIVGRNNSGKTSLTELFKRLLSDSPPKFSIEDFSLSAHEQFWKAFVLKNQNCDKNEVRNALPIIEVRLTIKYDEKTASFGPLGDFIIDLNLDCTEALVVIRYQLKDGEIDALFEDMQNDNRSDFFKKIKERVPKYYSTYVMAEDPNDQTNQKSMELSKLQTLIQNGFIHAQRGLDDITHKDRDVLSKVLETLLNTAMSDSADPKDRDIAQKLEDSVKDIQKGIDDGFNKQLVDLFPTFSLFGYPGLSDPRLLTETTLDVQRLLTNHTKVHYAGVNGINLPEAYNGLGIRNLIFILLKLLEYFKSFMVKESAPGFQLIFIEEPEVHLHPQMQEVFISNIGQIADVFTQAFESKIPWPVQFIITTHSSHLANRAPFESMRYFFTTPVPNTDNIFATQIKDLRKGLGDNSKEKSQESAKENTKAISKEDQEFLQKYMTLTRCDLFFADKAVLIEGTTERLLLPKIIEKVDSNQSPDHRLSSQYISVIEVGGAYAHRFFKLLDFLELRTLIITDLDIVNRNDSGKSCKVSRGTHTSNACIKNWFGDQNIAPDSLIEKSAEEKTRGIHRLAYEVPETHDAPCGRSFEDAFILANADLFGLTGESKEDREDEAWNKAKGVKKSDFALEYAIEKTDWTVPRYIADGLRWLAEGNLGTSVISSTSQVKPAITSGTSPEQEESNG